MFVYKLKSFLRPMAQFMPKLHASNACRATKCLKRVNAVYISKKLWPTSKIRRAVVTYRLEATVQRSTGYIANDGEKFILPNKLEITRKRNRMIERILDQKHYKSVGGRRNLNELES